jgi:cytochrome c oxidase cbb3-type subunit IV
MTTMDAVMLAKSLWPAWLILITLAIAFWAFRPRNRQRFERDGRIPLNDDHPESN